MRRFIPFAIAAILTLTFCNNANIVTGDENLLSAILNLLKNEHYQPVAINDNFSEKVFDNYMKKMDARKQFFTQKEFKFLKKTYSLELDNQMLSGESDFLDTTWAILNKRLSTLEIQNKELLGKPINFNTNTETLTIEDEPKCYANTETELEENWNKWVKWNVLDRLYRKLENQKNKDSAVKVLPYDTLELKARNETATFLTAWFKRQKGMDAKDKIIFYANCATEVFDPHTNYFPPEDKENFDIQMTGKLEGIGATLSQRDGYIKVERIMPGSASYKQGELKAGDLIIKVAQGKLEPVDVVDMKLDEAISLIRGKKGTEVRLTVKRVDGKIAIIPIVREEVVMEESYAKSGIVNINDKKYGVLFLPSFYADFAANGRGRNSSKDVQIELLKLQKAGVDGIILDLRNNGGGSLADAIEMGGHFVNKGPMVQVRMKENRIAPGLDKNEGIVYDGPLVVLTNLFSASASEILAGALQDYQRAIVLGSKSTYGKGTVQTFMPLDGDVTPVFKRGFGEIKLTIQKFYRINGKTTQLQGVIPDAIIPDLYDELEMGEKDMDYHLSFDEITAANYSLYAGTSMAKRSQAISLAKARIASNLHFTKISQKAKLVKDQKTNITYPLNLAKYGELQLKLKKESDEFDLKYKSELVVDALKEDIDNAAGNETKLAIKKDWLKMYKNDATLDEAVLILKDLNK